MSLITHHAAIVESAARDQARKLDRLFRRLGAASMHPGIHFDYYVRRAARARGARLELADVERALDRPDQFDSCRRREKAIYLPRPRDLVREQHRSESRARQHFDFA